jgi:hypothetical protein
MPADFVVIRARRADSKTAGRICPSEHSTFNIERMSPEISESHRFDFHTRLPFAHWLPRSVYGPLWRSLGLEDWADEENLNLLDRKSLNDVFAGQEVRITHMRFLCMPSNLIAWR